MATYVIGDVQGCYDELQELLHLIHYQPDKDRLWFTGDLVNRGPKSLQVLRFVKDLPNAVTVLGNHDLTLIALAHTKTSLKHHTLHDILNAPDRTELLNWLSSRPLAYYDAIQAYLLIHAGLPPQWTLSQAISYAHEVEDILQSPYQSEFLSQMYGDEPKEWQESLTGWERLRFITNALTRLRFCDAEGKIDLHYKGPIGSQPAHLMPWFKVPHRKSKNAHIVFGHWASLGGHCDEPHVYPLDTGCVWGNQLTAMRLEDGQHFNVGCALLKTK